MVEDLSGVGYQLVRRGKSGKVHLAGHREGPKGELARHGHALILTLTIGWIVSSRGHCTWLMEF